MKIRNIFLSILLLIILLVVGSLFFLHTQTGINWAVARIENIASSENRTVRLGQVEGLLSSEPKIGVMTIADRKGVWLSAKNVRMDWTRLALLKFDLAVNTLEADEIEVTRAPVSEPAADNSGSGKFSMPKLPVSISVDQLNIKKIHFGADLFGIDSSVSLNGKASLASGNLQSELAAQRLDQQGKINLHAVYVDKSGVVDVDFSLNEPANGIVANLLKLEDRPPLDLSLKGNGTLDELDLRLAMKAGANAPVSGLFALRKADDGRKFSMTVDGPVSLFVPADYRYYLGEQTALNANGLYKKNGNIAIDDMTFKSGVFDLAGQAEVLKDGFLRRLILRGTVNDKSGNALTLPGKSASIQSLNLDINYGNGATWQGKIIAENLSMPAFKADNFTLDLSGVTENLENASKRHVSIVANGNFNNITTLNAKIAQRLNHKLALNLSADISAKVPLNINDLSISANQFALNLKGKLTDMVFTGDLTLKADDLAPVALLTGTLFSGTVDIKAKSTVRLKGGLFDLALEGLTRNIKTGNHKLDRLLASDMHLSGSVLRDTSGFVARNFRLGNEEVMMTANGRFSLKSADMNFALNLSDLALLDERASGPVSVKGAARGDNNLIAVSLRATAPKSRLMTHNLNNGAVTLNLLLDSTGTVGLSLSGAVSGGGSFADKPLVLSGNFANSPEGLRLDDIKAQIGTAQINGTITRSHGGFLDGTVTLNAPDLSTFAAIALMEGKGALDAKFSFSPQNGVQTANIIAKADNAAIANVKITDLDLNATVHDLFGAPLVNGSINASEIQAAGFVVHSIKGDAKIERNRNVFQLTADMQDGLKASATGNFHAVSDTLKQLQLSTLNVSRGDVHAQLTSPATISFTKGDIDIRNFNLDTGDGKLSLNGVVADTLDLVLDINQLPLRLANIAKPDLGAEGTVAGSVRLQGTKQNPAITFDLVGNNLSVAKARQLGLAPLTLNAKGTTQDRMVVLNADIFGGDIRMVANGKLPVNTNDKMDLDVTLHDLPLKLANSVVQGQALGGEITGTAKVGGTYLNPTAQFNLEGQSLSAALLARSGLSPVQLSANGTFEDKVLILESMALQGPQNLNLKARGRLPIVGGGLDFTVDGSTPLSIANQFLATRGAQISAGTVTLNATVKGSLTQPELNGGIKVTNGDFIDAETNLRLKDINLDAVLREDKVMINSLTASSSEGGSINGKGSITVNAAQKLPTDLAINFNAFRYNDGKMITAVLSGQLTVAGALLKDPEIGGDITIERAEITIPDNFGGAGMIDVKHKNMTAPIKTTLERAELIAKPNTVPVPVERPSVPQMKLRVRAPNQFFIRGFGLDAEMGGQIRLFGPMTNIHPIGGFQMIRGRFDIMSQRVTFNEGRVTLVGNFNPQLYFVATTEGNDITVTITVSGTLETLNIAFTSSPQLPQDEILAQLLFNRSVSELSPFQLAQLASVAAQMAGLTNTSLMGALRDNTGLDDLDVTTDAKGNTGVKAGRYINENIYLGVEAGSGGSTKGTINLDITKSLKAKGAVGAGGDSSVGVFYEKDY